MPRATLDRLLAPRWRGAVGVVPLLIRVGTGVFLLGAGVGKLADHAKEVADFKDFGVPLPDLAVYASGVVEVVCGVLLVIGLLTRIAAALLAANLIGALLSAGVNVGGTFHLVVGPTILLLMLVLVWTGAGALSVDGLLTRRARQRPSSTT